MISIYGYSDDTVLIKDGERDIDDSIDCFNKDVVITLQHDDEKVKVYAMYRGTWVVGLAQYDEGVSIPDWAMDVNFDTVPYCDYTVAMTIDVPLGTTYVAETKKIGE